MAAGGTPACWSVDAVVVSASDTGGFVCRPLGDWVFLEEGRARQSRNEELDIDVGWTPPDLGDAGHDTLTEAVPAHLHGQSGRRILRWYSHARAWVQPGKQLTGGVLANKATMTKNRMRAICAAADAERERLAMVQDAELRGQWAHIRRGQKREDKNVRRQQEGVPCKNIWETFSTTTASMLTGVRLAVGEMVGAAGDAFGAAFGALRAVPEQAAVTQAPVPPPPVPPPPPEPEDAELVRTRSPSGVRVPSDQRSAEDLMRYAGTPGGLTAGRRLVAKRAAATTFVDSEGNDMPASAPVAKRARFFYDRIDAENRK